MTSHTGPAGRLEDLIAEVLDATPADLANVLYWAARQGGEMVKGGLVTRLQVVHCFARAAVRRDLDSSEADRVIFAALGHAGVIR
jgi:hypothetical protein